MSTKHVMILILLHQTHVGLIRSNFIPGDPGRADFVLRSLGSFGKLQHVPLVSSYRRCLQGQRQPLHCHHGWPALPKGTESRNGELGWDSFSFSRSVYLTWTLELCYHQAIIGIAFSLGFTLGPLLGAYFAVSSKTSDNIIFQTPALLALAFSMGDLFFIWFMLPETLTVDAKVVNYFHYVC